MAVEKKVQCLIIGANGLIGRRLGRNLLDKGIKCIGTFNKRPENGLLKLDITSPEEGKAIFAKYSPEVVFHCGNLAGGVDFYERNPKIATDFHLNATKNLGKYCIDINAAMVFLSTDYVFDGTNGPYKENDSANPINLHGKLKLKAEKWIQQNLKRHLIIRTTNVYGWDPDTVTPNYIMNLYRTVKAKKSFHTPSFLWGSPTYVGDLAEAIVELYTKKAYGIFHVVGSSFINRLEWVNEACEILELDNSLINEIKQPTANMASRPLKPWLSTKKFRSSFKTTLHNVHDGLKLMKRDIRNSRNTN